MMSPTSENRATLNTCPGEGARLGGSASLRFWLLLLGLAAACWLGAGRALAQETPESRAFKVAAGFFGLRVYDRAEREFQQFVQTYPQSPMLPEAILLQARAAMEQTNMASPSGC